MEDQNGKLGQQQQHQQPNSMNSFNQRRQEGEEGRAENVTEKKDESQGYTDYNGNSEANAPARAREE